MAMVIKIIRNLIDDCIDRGIIEYSRRNEINKYRDRRRVKIYSTIKLTNRQKQAVDRFFVENYGKKIPYIWHRHFTAFTGQFDEKYFPELLYIPEFEHFMNMYKEYRKVFADKNVLPIIAEKVNVKTPELVLSCSRGAYRDSEYRIMTKENVVLKLSSIGEVFVKPSVDSSSGRGCFILNIKKGYDTTTGKPLLEIMQFMGDNFVIQKKIICHNSLRKIYPHSVNTFRIISYRWKDEIRLLPAIMRFGRGGKFLDNAHAGGGFIGISDAGVLCKKGYTEFKEEFLEHPDTHVVFENYEIACFAEILKAVKRMHEAIPQIGCVNWDFTLDESGSPILIEANINSGSIWLIEMAHGKGAFGDDTADILHWLRFMKKLPKSKRTNYTYGRKPINLT